MHLHLHQRPTAAPLDGSAKRRAVVAAAAVAAAGVGARPPLPPSQLSSSNNRPIVSAAASAAAAPAAPAAAPSTTPPTSQPLLLLPSACASVGRAASLAELAAQLHDVAAALSPTCDGASATSARRRRAIIPSPLPLPLLDELCGRAEGRALALMAAAASGSAADASSSPAAAASDASRVASALASLGATLRRQQGLSSRRRLAVAEAAPVSLPLPPTPLPATPTAHGSSIPLPSSIPKPPAARRPMQQHHEHHHHEQQSTHNQHDGTATATATAPTHYPSKRFSRAWAAFLKPRLPALSPRALAAIGRALVLSSSSPSSSPPPFTTSTRGNADWWRRYERACARRLPGMAQGDVVAVAKGVAASSSRSDEEEHEEDGELAAALLLRAGNGAESTSASPLSIAGATALLEALPGRQKTSSFSSPEAVRAIYGRSLQGLKVAGVAASDDGDASATATTTTPTTTPTTTSALSVAKLLRAAARQAVRDPSLRPPDSWIRTAVVRLGAALQQQQPDSADAASTNNKGRAFAMALRALASMRYRPKAPWLARACHSVRPWLASVAAGAKGAGGAGVVTVASTAPSAAPALADALAALAQLRFAPSDAWMGAYGAAASACFSSSPSSTADDRTLVVALKGLAQMQPLLRSQQPHAVAPPWTRSLIAAVRVRLNGMDAHSLVGALESAAALALALAVGRQQEEQQVAATAAGPDADAEEPATSSSAPTAAASAKTTRQQRRQSLALAADAAALADAVLGHLTASPSSFALSPHQASLALAAAAKLWRAASGWPAAVVGVGGEPLSPPTAADPALAQLRRAWMHDAGRGAALLALAAAALPKEEQDGGGSSSLSLSVRSLAALGAHPGADWLQRHEKRMLLLGSTLQTADARAVAAAYAALGYEPASGGGAEEDG